MAALWAIKQYRPYLWGKRLVLITDCSAIAWQFTSQTLSAKDSPMGAQVNGI